MSLIYFYKTAGALIIAFIGVYITTEYSRSVKMELSSARDAERLIRYIGQCITYRGDTIEKIIGSYVGDCDASAEVWRRAAETTLAEALTAKPIPFDEKTSSILTEFASQLGRGYREPQIELCGRTSSQLAEHIAALDASKRDRLRVSSAVCVFVCLSFIILLI